MQVFPPSLSISSPRARLLSLSQGDSLEELDTTILPDAAICAVQGGGALYQLDKTSTAAVSPPDVIATAAGAGAPGRWAIVQGGGSVLPTIGQFYVNGSVVAGGDGSLLAPFQTVSEAYTGIVVAGVGAYTVHIAAGTYAETLTIPTERTIVHIGDGYADTIVGGLALNHTWVLGGDSALSFENLQFKGSIAVTAGATVPDQCSIIFQPWSDWKTSGAGIIQTGASRRLVLTAQSFVADSLNFGIGDELPSFEGNVTIQGDVHLNTVRWESGDFSVKRFYANASVVIGGNITASDGIVELLNATKISDNITFTGSAGQVLLDFSSDYQWLASGATITNGEKELLDSIGEWTVLSPVQNQNVDGELAGIFGDPNVSNPQKVLIASEGDVKISTPIRMGSYQQLEGLGRTRIVPTYASGPCVMIGQDRGAPPHGVAPTIPGQDYSVRFATAHQFDFWFDLGRNALRPTALSAFCIQWYMRPHTSLSVGGDGVFLWGGSHDSQDPLYSAASFSFSSTGCVYEMRTTAGQIQSVGIFSFVLGTEYEMAFTWDGTNARLFAGGALIGTSALAGTFSPLFFEEMFWGPAVGTPYPEGGSFSGCANFDLGAFRVSRIARFTAPYTPAATTFTPDADDLISWVPLTADEKGDLSVVKHGASTQTGWMQTRRGDNSFYPVTTSTVSNIQFNGAIDNFFGTIAIQGTAAINTTIENCGGEELAQLVDLWDNCFGSQVINPLAVGGGPRSNAAAPVPRNGIGLSGSCSLCVLDTLNIRSFRIGLMMSNSDSQGRNFFIYQSYISEIQLVNSSGQFSGINTTDEGGGGATLCAIEYVPGNEKSILNFEGSIDVTAGTPIPILISSIYENVFSASLRFKTALATTECIKFYNPGSVISPVTLQTRPMIQGGATPISLNPELIANFGEVVTDGGIFARYNGLKAALAITLSVIDSQSLSTGAVPGIVTRDGTNFPVYFLAFDDTLDELTTWKFEAKQYSGGNLRVTLYWYSESATSGNVVWAVSLAAVTPGDAGSFEAKAFAAATNGTSACLGTTAKRLTSVAVTISGASLDSIVQGDLCCLKVSRLGSSGSDTMTGDADLQYITVQEV